MNARLAIPGPGGRRAAASCRAGRRAPVRLGRDQLRGDSRDAPAGRLLAGACGLPPFWEKPPLFFWMQVGAMEVFGVDEFAARLPNALCGVVTLLVLFRIGRRLLAPCSGAVGAGLPGLGAAPPLLPQRHHRSVVQPVHLPGDRPVHPGGLGTARPHRHGRVEGPGRAPDAQPGPSSAGRLTRARWPSCSSPPPPASTGCCSASGCS